MCRLDIEINKGSCDNSLLEQLGSKCPVISFIVAKLK